MDKALLDKMVPLTAIQKQHFKIMDQGQYQYHLNGESTDIQEPWQILENGNLQIIRSVRYSEKYRVKLSVVAHISEGNQVVDISYSEGDSPDINAEYRIDGQGNWKVTQSHPGDIFQQHGCVEGLVIFPLLRIFSGTMLQDCKIDNGQQKQVLVPDIRLATRYNDKLKPSFDLRKTKSLGTNGKGKKLSFTSEHYQEDQAEFYLNKLGQLSQYCWQQKPDVHWQVYLVK